ncbi:hypothetical protein Ddye_028181 [Dipteronia dyeriana]|uniref:RNase H type-1 domain-containing protein n=1 Tax=Dipteronia dyeriana TaxID=168575 RepID=A0AAD9TR65_9ROSI|nr:hypothetical protein Ddye_028181 [Dipteronia dyeriana]
MGVGIIIRDGLGDVFTSSAQHLEMRVSPAVVEAVTIYKGLILAWDSRLRPWTVESDAEVVVNLIAAGSIPLSDIGIIISDIFLLLRFWMQEVPLSVVPAVPGDRPVAIGVVSEAMSSPGLQYSDGAPHVWPPSISQ